MLVAICIKPFDLEVEALLFDFGQVAISVDPPDGDQRLDVGNHLVILLEFNELYFSQLLGMLFLLNLIELGAFHALRFAMLVGSMCLNVIFVWVCLRKQLCWQNLVGVHNVPLVLLLFYLGLERIFYDFRQNLGSFRVSIFFVGMGTFLGWWY